MSEQAVKDNQDLTPEQVAVPDKFKTADGSVNTEALLKSYTDLEKDRSRVVTEISNLKKDLEATKASSEMAETLKAIAANTAPKAEKTPSYDEYIQTLAEKTASEMGLEVDDPAVKLAVRLNSESVKAWSSWAKEDIETLKSEYEKKIEELKGFVVSDKSERVKSSSEYLANKADIDEMVQAGFEESKAIQFVLSKSATRSDMSTPPPSTPNGRVTGAKVENTYWSSPEEREVFVQRFGEEETIKTEKVGMARLNRTMQEVA